MPIHTSPIAPFPTGMRRQPGDTDADRNDDTTDSVASLRRRISAARVLREHLVWEAVRVLPGLAGFREARDDYARFRQLMERDDLGGAILLLAASAAPRRELLELSQVSGIWSCRLATVAAQRGRRPRIHAAHHPDRAAALLAALVASGCTDA
ncbi:hypothetical protein SAMN05892877_11736 [Rhizobium subbaraonis]|uniref:Uncharacterized protein n=1 Tax=Rhizobium subbaraonis TaxID=908946 RepID=A0A285UZH5_9HYPH|nr:hypothetical protein [Rhizobium subbaraonis]SOC45651.1 hypothetical protein SAMN05892877_11736 [Rhizobium subbaraonis]